MRKKISIISPCYNEEEGILECYQAIKKLFQNELQDYDLEHIFCDNASTDKTVQILREIAVSDPCVKVIINSRNFGILRNTYNGVLSSSGDAVVLFLPVDLQDPPELIPTFVKHWASGYDIVYGIRAQREEGFFIRNARHAYYRLLSRLSYIDYPPDVGDFQLVDRRVLDAMQKTSNAQPFMRMMTFDCGFRSIGVKYTWQERKHGKSKNQFIHMIDQGLSGIISFSNIPVRLALFVGFFISGASLLYSLTIFFLIILGIIEEGPRGIPTLIIAVFFFGGLQLFFLGVVGEYIMAIFNQVRNRPLVIEMERINFEKNQDS